VTRGYQGCIDASLSNMDAYLNLPRNENQETPTILFTEIPIIDHVHT
jgi:hypothetical protein